MLRFEERVQENRSSVRSVCTRSGKRAGIGLFLRSVYRKSSFCAFCVDQLRGRVLDGCHGRAWERRGVRAVESWYRESASCAFYMDTLERGVYIIRQRRSNWAGRRWHDGIRLVVRIGRSAHEITTGGCLQAKMPRQNAPFCRACTRKPLICTFCMYTLG
jgi:hypothetical protein